VLLDYPEDLMDLSLLVLPEDLMDLMDLLHLVLPEDLMDLMDP
jgi:hypothetical protein